MLDGADDSAPGPGERAEPGERPEDPAGAGQRAAGPAQPTLLGRLGASDLGEGPFRREGLLARTLPFALVAVLAELSLALPPGPASALDTALSAALLGAAAVAAVAVPWRAAPRALAVAVPLACTASMLPLIMAAGGISSGMSIVLFLPLIWTALFHRPWESACVIAETLAVLFAVSVLARQEPAADIIRRLVFWGALAAVIAVAAHGLRRRIRRSQDAAARLQGRLRELSILQDRDRIASSLQDTVAQRLFAAGLSLQGIGSLAGAPEVSRRIDSVVRNLDEAIRLLRQSIFGLEHGLPEQGLRRSILEVTSELTPVLGVVPEVALEGPIDSAVPPGVAGPLLSTLRDALAQSGAAADATRVAVSVAVVGDEVRLTVSDNGSRWAARAAIDDRQLSGLRHRASRLGGAFDISAAPDGGARLTWRAPLPAGGGGASLSARAFPVARAEPDGDRPQAGEHRAEPVHDGHDHARADHAGLQDAAGRQRPAGHPRPGHDPGEQQRGGGHGAPGDQRGPGRDVADADRDRDGEDDHDRLHPENGGA